METDQNELLKEDPELQMYTLSEAARILRIDPTNLGRRVQRGEITAMHLGRRVLIRRQDLDKFIREHMDD